MAVGDKLQFFPFKRSILFGGVRQGTDGRLRGELELTLQDMGGDPLTGRPSFTLLSAADVSGLQPGAILHVAPSAFATNAETTKFVHVDFVEQDLPWRYTPTPNSNQLSPWLVLLVGTPQELKVEGNLVKSANNIVLDAHPLKDSHLWAHVQDDGGRAISRILSPRPLEPQREYVAALVPAFNAQGQPLWMPGAAGLPGVVPAFYSWRFWTGEAGDFETLAAALRKRKVEDLGIATVRYVRKVSGVDVTLQVRGAISSSAEEIEATTEITTARRDLDTLKKELSVKGEPKRKILGLPDYGRPWLSDPNSATWGKTLNHDPRFRGIAGLGVWLGIEAQDQLMDAAVKQAGALRDASQLIRQLAMGLGAARGLWERRLPDDPILRLQVLGPAMARLLTTQGGTALEQVTLATSPLPPALFSSTAQRFLRDGTPRARHLKNEDADAGVNAPETQARRLDRAQALKLMNTGPAPLADVPSGLPHVNPVAKELGMPPLEILLEMPEIPANIWQVVQAFDGRPNDDATRQELLEELGLDPFCLIDFLNDPAQMGTVLDADMLIDVLRAKCFSGTVSLPSDSVDPKFIAESAPPSSPPWFRPIDLEKLSNAIARVIDPTQARPPAWVYVQAVIEGLELKTLAPPELPLGLDFPTWQLLNRYAKEWMLPGVGRVPKDTMVALKTNPAFVDAFMVGINTQFMQEMRWRDLAITRTFTPLRMFWGYIHYEQNNVRREADIEPFSEWVKHPETDIGDVTHQTRKPDDATGKQDLVIAFKTDLFRRYPSTLVYLVKKTGHGDAQDTELLKQTPVFEHTAQERAARTFLGPIFICDLEPDLRCFMFDLAPPNLDEYWLVLDEPPSELRFRNDKPPDTTTTDSAKFATSTIDEPTRVAIDGKWLEEQADQ